MKQKIKAAEFNENFEKVLLAMLFFRDDDYTINELNKLGLENLIIYLEVENETKLTKGNAN